MAKGGLQIKIARMDRILRPQRRDDTNHEWRFYTMQLRWNGETVELKALCKRLGLNPHTVLSRVLRGEEPLSVVRSALGRGRRSHPYIHCDPHSIHKNQRRVGAGLGAHFER